MTIQRTISNINRQYYELKILYPEMIIKEEAQPQEIKDQKEFEHHIKKLLDLGCIDKSKSPHRSSVIIVNKHSKIVRGESRMIINYKRLNNNTQLDSYNIPNKKVLINKIQNSYWHSKFDCKSGFWQVKMHPESKKWTAFTCTEGHFKWNVMLFGLKNAPQIFQRKMDEVFIYCKDFTCIYIDDILIFSKNKEEHTHHLK